MFDAEKFLNTYHIQSWLPGSKNVPAGCVGVRCPLCGDSKNHLHFRLGTTQVKCWRCGRHRLVEVVMALLSVDERAAREVIKTFSTDGPQRTTQRPEVIRADNLTFPGGTGPLQSAHSDYLTSRGFDPVELQRVWGVRGTNHLDPFYRWRVIAPVTENYIPLSFQARAILPQQAPPYLACRPEDEVVSHKELLYGVDLAIKNRVVVVEGITDAWRLGPGSVATFGVKWTVVQAQRLLARQFKTIFILYDPDDPGQLGATALYCYLRGFKEEVEVLRLTGAADPGSLPVDEAKYIMRQLIS